MPRYDIPYSWYWQGLPLRSQLQPVYTGPEPCPSVSSPSSSSSSSSPSMSSSRSQGFGQSQGHRPRRKEVCHDPYCIHHTPDSQTATEAEAEAAAATREEGHCWVCPGPSSIQYHTHAYFYPSMESSTNPRSRSNSTANYELDNAYYDYMFCPCVDCQEYISCCSCLDCRPERERRTQPGSPRRDNRNNRDSRTRTGRTGDNRTGHLRCTQSTYGAGRDSARTDTDSSGWSECEEECCVTRYPRRSHV